MNTKTKTEQEHSSDTKHAKHVNLERLLQFQHGLDIYIYNVTHIYTLHWPNRKQQGTILYVMTQLPVLPWKQTF